VLISKNQYRDNVYVFAIVMKIKTMKKLAAFVFIAILSFNCHKKTEKVVDNGPHVLEGHWKLKETRVSPGFAVINWTPAPSDTLYVDFSAGNVFRSNSFLFAGYTSYQVQNDSLMVLSGSSATINVYYRFPESLLQLNPTCFEECSYRFKR
jgi:hypothetical protein